MPASNHLVYLDVETTGLDPERHQVWEIAYAIGDGPIRSSLVHHGLAGADETALEVTNYRERMFDPFDPFAAVQFEGCLAAELEGATIVGANPAFDAAFLRARWGVAPWRYRYIDVETFAMPALGYETPKGLATTARDVEALTGATIPPPDHTAARDVETARAVYLALVDHYATRLPEEFTDADA